jgi:hypothetical protein
LLGPKSTWEAIGTVSSAFATLYSFKKISTSFIRIFGCKNSPLWTTVFLLNHIFIAIASWNSNSTKLVHHLLPYFFKCVTSPCTLLHCLPTFSPYILCRRALLKDVQNCHKLEKFIGAGRTTPGAPRGWCGHPWFLL